MKSPVMTAFLHDAVDRELVGGEHLLWAAQPRAAAMRSAFTIWLVAIPWTAFALLSEGQALAPWFAKGMPMSWGSEIVSPLFGVPFILIGFWMLAKPFRMMAEATKTAFALTDRRILKVVLAKQMKVVSVFTDRIGPIQRTESADGWGALRIQTHSRIDSDGDRVAETFEMIGIPDVAHVQRMIVERQK